MFGCVLFVLTCLELKTTLAEKSLCGPSMWFYAEHHMCLPCTTCSHGQLMLASCSAKQDAICVNLKRLDLHDAWESGTAGGAKDAEAPWGEAAVEGERSSYGDLTAESIVNATTTIAARRSGTMLPPSSSKSPLAHASHTDASWNTTGLVVLGVMIAVVVAVATLLLVRRLRYRDRRHRKTDSSAACNRARLFSRDRLDTTEYMHSLATLDRKLAMDEILEKRRRAIFAQDMEGERKNYMDEVFLEVSDLTVDEGETQDSRREDFR